ncbi:MAG: hypothetical protein IPN88_15790 [Bacteroidetes bacterium]|nr:hypothetical protein [Bacteroidota bacterium]
MGVPFIRYNDFVGRIGYLRDIEDKYKLGYGIKPDNTEELFNRLNILLTTEDLQKVWHEKQQIMLLDKVDVSAYFTKLIVDIATKKGEFSKS